MGMEQKGSNQTQIATSSSREVRPYTPQFSFTKSIIDQLTQRGITQKDYGFSVENLDTYLKKAAEIEEFTALGIVAVPSSEGWAGSCVAEGGYVLNSAAYFKLSRQQCDPINNKKRDPRVESMDNGWTDLTFDDSDNHLAIALVYTSVSQEECPTLEAFKATLEDDAIRTKEYTYTAEHSEFWGMVTREELLREMAQNQSSTS